MKELIDGTGKRMNHVAGSLEEMVENLVKNWEVEASFKTRLSDWRTIDHEKYSFAMGGGNRGSRITTQRAASGRPACTADLF